MKFAKYLEEESIPEWRKAYLDYKGLKKRLKVIEKYREKNKQARRASKLSPELPNALPKNKRHVPQRAMTSILDNRSSSLPTRQSFTKGLFNQLSSHFSRQETELDNVSYRSSASEHSQATVLLDEMLENKSEPEKYFFIVLDKELDKIAIFYDEKEDEALSKYEALKMQINLVRNFADQLSKLKVTQDLTSADNQLNPMHWFKRTDENLHVPGLPDSIHYNGDHHISYNVARSRLKKAITEFYRSLELIKSYKVLNETGFRKILKKFDKTAGWKASPIYMEKVAQYHWSTSTKLNHILSSTEKLFISEFAEGHRRKGMSKLRTPEREESYTPTAWRIGFYTGLSLAFFAHILQLTTDPEVIRALPNIYYNLQMYACMSLPILFCLGFAINTLVWHRSHINYKFIFEFDSRDNMSYNEFAELPSLMLFIMAFIMYIDFSQIFAPTIPSELCPLLLFLVLLSIMTCPFPILYYSSRRWLAFTLGRIVFSYCFPIEFRDFFIADELNSLAYSFWTLTYMFCAYRFNWQDLPNSCPVTMFWFTPFIASLPPWWRFLQCIRRYQDSGEKVHLVNGLKYITSISATMVTGIRRFYSTPFMDVLWLICCIVNSSYTSIWDLKMDWGLFQPGSKHLFLRDEVVFYRWTYYVAAPINVILRFAWTLNAAGLNMKSELLGFLTALLEVYRRIQWNFFRLENEHINNCGNYRAIKEIPLPFAFNSPNENMELEEGAIQLPAGSSELPVPPSPVKTIHHDILYDMAGTFYGRRDFENRPDSDDDQYKLKRQTTAVGAVLERIMSSRRRESVSEDSASGEDDDDDDDDDDDADDETN